MGKWPKISILLLSFVVVAFGQPAWSWWCGLIAAAVGYACFWRLLLEVKNPWQRFWAGTLWFMAVQMVQLSWFVSHPYLYIYLVYVLLSFALGVQFGILSILVTPKALRSAGRLVGIAAIWTLMEWLRLFFMSGFSWNPVGMALSGSLYSLQMASIWGVFGLSFWVILVNLLVLKAWAGGWVRRTTLVWFVAAMLPYVYGMIHVGYHDSWQRDHDGTFTTVLVQTSFPSEEALGLSARDFVDYVVKEWGQIFRITDHQREHPVHLIALPEFVVPFGTYSYAFPHETIKAMLVDILGPKIDKAFPDLGWPLADRDGDGNWLVNNAFLAQTLANYHDADVVMGLEDAEHTHHGEIAYYSAAIHFQPNHGPEHYPRPRYAKRVLVPMGEYIPFAFMAELARSYGVMGSFKAGEEAKVFSCKDVPFGLSICYEETFGDLMRESRQNGAQLLVNLTNDGWYPNSRLPQQHFDHARLRGAFRRSACRYRPAGAGKPATV